MTYIARWSPTAVKELEGLPRELAIKADEVVLGLCEAPRPSGAKKLRGSKNLYRVEFRKDYRIIYAVHDAAQIVSVDAIVKREDAY